MREIRGRWRARASPSPPSPNSPGNDVVEDNDHEEHGLQGVHGGGLTAWSGEGRKARRGTAGLFPLRLALLLLLTSSTLDYRTHTLIFNHF